MTWLSAAACIATAWACRSAALGAAFASTFMMIFAAAPRHGLRSALVFAPLAIVLGAIALRGRSRARSPERARPANVAAWGMRLAAAVAAAGAVAAAQWLAGAAAAWAGPEQMPPPIAALVAAAMRVLGADATADGARIAAQGATRAWWVHLTPDTFALGPMLQLVLGAIAWLAIYRGRAGLASRAVVLAAGGVVYAFVRVVALALLYVQVDTVTGGGGGTRMALFVSPTCTALSLLPLMWAWALILREGPDSDGD